MNKISKAEFEYCKQKHWELWDWVAKHPDEIRYSWFDENKIQYVHNGCFACHIAGKITGGDNICRCCPITADGAEDCCDTLFETYIWARDEENAIKTSHLAEQIRDLPWDKNNILDYVED